MNKIPEDVRTSDEIYRERNAFLSNMSHEVRTPLNAILGMTDIGINAGTLEEKDYALRKIGDASSHLLDIISNVLDMAMIEDGKFELSPCEFVFRDMLDKIMSLMRYLANEKHQTIKVNVDAAIPRSVIGDDVRISRLLSNLISNAVKFTPIYGKIQVDVTVLRDCDDHLELLIIIRDNGIGMTKDRQGKVYTALENLPRTLTRERSGMGFGLVISKHIVNLMDGDIRIESQPNKGTTVSLTIMVAKGRDSSIVFDTASAQESSISGDRPFAIDEFHGKRLLIVEDVEINREIVIALLKDSGLKIDYAEDGQMAVDMVMFNVEKYDIVFMDLHMPNLGGLDATRMIRKLPKRERGHLPIIAMTANNTTSDIKACSDAGMDDYLCKPLDIEKVLSILRKYLLSGNS